MTYNDIIQTPGKRIKIKVRYTTPKATFPYYVSHNVDDDKIESAKIFSKNPLIGTGINGCELVLNDNIDLKTDVIEIYVSIEAKYGQETQTKQSIQS